MAEPLISAFPFGDEKNCRLGPLTKRTAHRAAHTGSTFAPPWRAGWRIVPAPSSAGIFRRQHAVHRVRLSSCWRCTSPRTVRVLPVILLRSRVAMATALPALVFSDVSAPARSARW